MVLQDLMESETSSERFRAARLVLKLSGINASNLWKDDVEQLAIEAGGTPSPSSDKEIEAMVRSLTDTQALENKGSESDKSPPPA